MLSVPFRRKVLVLNEKLAIRNLLNLLKKVDRENLCSASGVTQLASLAQGQLDAVVLDLRCSNRKMRDEIRGIGEVRTGRAGRLLVIVAEVNGPKSMDLFERYVFKGLPEALLWLVSHRYQLRQS